MSVAAILVPFGFTALEAEIYVFLLSESPATGYRIAQGINKPAANTYKAIQTLQSKGAVLVEESASRACRAVPLAELMNRLQKDFESRRKQAEKALKSVGKAAEDDRIYHLKSRDQILGRISEMLQGAKSSLILKLPAFGLHAIEGEIERAMERGITLSILCPETTVIKSIEIVLSPDGPSGSAIAVMDGSQLLMGRISQDSESEAIWTKNSILAEVQHGALASEYTLAMVAIMLASDEKRSRMIKAIESRPRLA